jgi:hypothetical protein
MKAAIEVAMAVGIFALGSAAANAAGPIRNAATPARSETADASAAGRGRTTVTGTFGAIRVVATLAAHEVAIGPPSGSPPEHRMNGCTYSRRPCSLVDLVEIRVGGRRIDIPRSVFADWADLARLRLSSGGRGRYKLSAQGGDAAEAYRVDVVFDGRRVLERSVIWEEAEQVTERTVYYSASIG